MSKTVTGGSEQRESGRAERNSRSAILWAGIVLLVLSVGSIAVTVVASIDRTLSQLETTLFSVLTFVLSIAGSVIVSAYYSRNQARENYVQLARPAWRRVVALSGSADQIAEAVRAKQQLVDGDKAIDPKVAAEWLDAIERLLHQHSGQLQAAISDWQELLPQEFAELVDLKRLRTEIDARMAEVATLGDRQSEESRAAIAKLKSEIAALTKNLDQRQSSLIPTESPMVTNWSSTLRPLRVPGLQQGSALQELLEELQAQTASSRTASKRGPQTKEKDGTGGKEPVDKRGADEK